MAGQTSVKPLVSSNIAWTEFLKNVAELTGHSPSRGIDSSNLKLSGYACFLASLGEFQSGKEQNPLDILRNDDYLLRHLFFGFLISGSTSLIFRIMELTDLDVTTAKSKNKGRVAIVTGNLQRWKDAIVICLNQSLIKNFELRWAFNQCLDCFYSAGLRNIFDDYRKKGLKDKTFLLEYKE
jgi:hypothetical protein